MVFLENLTTAQIGSLPTTGGRLIYDSELNNVKYRDGTSTATVVVADSSGNVNITAHDGSAVGLELGGVLVTATAAELNILDGVTATASEINYLDLTTGAGTAEASKAVVLDSSSNITGINNLTNSGDLTISGHDGSSAGLILGATLVTATAAELNVLDGITSTTAELNILDGVTATASEINYLDLTTGAGTAEASKAVVLDSSSNITGINNLTNSGDLTISGHDGSSAGLILGATLVTATAAELNILDGVTATASEINYLDLTTGAGTAEASKALVLDSSSNITGINELTTTTITTDNLNVTGDISFVADDATGNTELNALTITRTTSDTPATGLGVGIDFQIENSVNTNTLYGTLAVVADDINDTTEDGKFDFRLISGGTEDVSVATLDSAGLFSTTSVTATNLTGTLQTASQPNITSVGTLTSATVSGDLTLSGHDGSATGLILGATLVTATATELNVLDGITSTTAELNILDGVTATSAEINYLDLTTGAGTAEANKALVLDASSNITGINNLTLSGDLVVNGTTTTINSTVVTIDDNTILLNASPAGTGNDTGFLAERYQNANDAGTGDIVSDSAAENYALSAATSTTITLPAGGNAANDYYNNWWIKITSGTATDEVRQITAYDGTTKVATLASAFTSTPSASDTVNLYSNVYSALVWQESSDCFVSGYVSADSTTTLTIHGYSDFKAKDIYTTGLIGVNTTAPDAQLEINSATGDCLRLTYNDSNGSATNYADFSVDSSGVLSITPSSDSTIFNSSQIIDYTGAGAFNIRRDGAGNSGLTVTTHASVDTKVGINRNPNNLNQVFEINGTSGGKVRLIYNDYSTTIPTNYCDLYTNIVGDLIVGPSSGYSQFVSGARFTTSTNHNNALQIRDNSSNTVFNVSTLSNVVGVNTTGTSTTSLEINHATGSCLKLTYNDTNGSPTNYTDLTVSSGGDLSITPSGGFINIEGSQIIDVTGTEALLVRKNADAGDVFIVDTTNSRIGVGIAPTAPLHVSDSDSNVALLASTTVDGASYIELQNETGTQARFGADGTGLADTSTANVLVGNWSNGDLDFATNAVVRASLDTAGDFSAVTLTETSDVRVKENIQLASLEDSYVRINQVQIKDYNFIDYPEHQHRGVIAQELREIIPDAVRIKNRNGYDDFHTVSNKELVGYLIAAFQHLSKKVEELEKKH